MSNGNQETKRRQIEEINKKNQELNKLLAYVHAQAALQHEKQKLQHDHAPIRPNPEELLDDGQDLKSVALQWERTKQLEQRLREENKMLAADTQLGICYLSSGNTFTSDQSTCYGTTGVLYWSAGL